jgi:hypothetical protein
MTPESMTPPGGLRSQMREILSKEPVIIAQVTERKLPKFEQTLTQLDRLSQADGLLPITGNPQETNKEWLSATRGLWLVGSREADFSVPENTAGFVSVYAPEHMGSVNDWLAARGMRGYDNGAVVELSSFVRDVPNATAIELSADKQALAKVFLDEGFKDVRAVTVWETHNPQNEVDPAAAEALTTLGAVKLGSLRYNENEPVDSSAFLITRRAFLDAMTGASR